MKIVHTWLLVLDAYFVSILVSIEHSWSILTLWYSLSDLLRRLAACRIVSITLTVNAWFALNYSPIRTWVIYYIKALLASSKAERTSKHNSRCCSSQLSPLNSTKPPFRRFLKVLNVLIFLYCFFKLNSILCFSIKILNNVIFKCPCRL